MLLKLYDKNNNPQDLQRVTDILNDGGLIIYPTDTMYAIGCHGLIERACHRTYLPYQGNRSAQKQSVHHLL